MLKEPQTHPSLSNHLILCLSVSKEVIMHLTGAGGGGTFPAALTVLELSQGEVCIVGLKTP